MSNIWILTVLTFPFITNTLTCISIRSNFDDNESEQAYAENDEDVDNTDYYENDYSDYYESSFYDITGYGYMLY